MANSASILLYITAICLKKIDSWILENIFFNRMKHIFSLNLEKAGSCQKFENLIPDLLQKVILRLLRAS